MHLLAVQTNIVSVSYSSLLFVVANAWCCLLMLDAAAVCCVDAAAVCRGPLKLQRQLWLDGLLRGCMGCTLSV